MKFSGLVEWRTIINEMVTGQMKLGINSLVLLGAWTLWKHRNQRVFEGGNPSIDDVLEQVGEERRL
jgi:hypothetical protein